MDTNNIKPISVLVVEDDFLNLTLLEGLLQQSSMAISRVESAGTLRSTLALLANNQYDVILLDLNLPDSMCLNTLRTVAKKRPEIPIVVITGAYDEDFGPKAISCGAQKYLLKGKYDAQMLAESILYSIKRKRSEITQTAPV